MSSTTTGQSRRLGDRLKPTEEPQLTSLSHRGNIPRRGYVRGECQTSLLNRHSGVLLQLRTLRQVVKSLSVVMGGAACKKPPYNIGEETFTRRLAEGATGGAWGNPNPPSL